MIATKTASVEIMIFDALCALLPPETNWGDMLTPKIVEQIVLAEREACAKVASASTSLLELSDERGD